MMKMMMSTSSSNISTTTCASRQQYHQQEDHRRHMASLYGSNRWLWTAVLFGLLIVTVSAKDEVSFEHSTSSTTTMILKFS